MKIDGIVSLPCRATHQVYPCSVTVKENDALYDIFTKRAGRSTNFMREWLKLFVIMHKAALAQKAKGYFKQKGLDVNTWAESIVDGRKGDVAVLFVLNLMMETHCLVHLANGQVWTTLAKTSGDHTKELHKCSVHLVYIGRGLFVELKERPIPLKVIEDAPTNVTSLVIGELTSSKSKIIDQVMTLGLGKAKDGVKKAATEPVPSTSRETSIPTETDNIASKEELGQHKVSKPKDITRETSTCTPLTIDVVRLNPKMQIPHLITPKELADCPLSAHREPGYQNLLYNPLISDKDSVHSNTTEDYWPEYAEKHPEILQATDPKTMTQNCIKRRNKAKFKLLTHSICRR